MAKLLKLRRGTTTQHGSFAGAEGEVTVDTTKDVVVVHTGGGAGTGVPMAKETDITSKAPINSPTFTGTVAIPNIANLESAVAANTAKVTNVTTNLSVTANGTSLTVASSDGTDASIPAVTTSAWGAMTDEDKTKLDGIATGATANAGDATKAGDNTWTGSQRGEVSDVGTKTANFDFDLDTSNNFKITIGANAKEFGFTNIDAGQSGTIEVVNGAYTLSYGSECHFPGGTPPVLTQSATSFLAYYCPSDSVVIVQNILNVKAQS